MKKINTSKIKVLIKGAGEHSSGTAYRLFKSGFDIIMTEIEQPQAVRRTVAFCTAIYDNEITVENVTAKKVDKNFIIKNLDKKNDFIPVIIDPECKIKEIFKPDVLIDARILKHNPDTNINDAELVLAYGPGYCAGKDCDIVIETNRGHNLGRLIYNGESEPNTGSPGAIVGVTGGRVVRSPKQGTFFSEHKIGDYLKKNEIFGYVNNTEIKSQISGIIRGQIKPGINVNYNTKIGDVDPRADKDYCYKLSDKTRNISGSALEAILNHFKS